ncbi:MAG: hypothetical protein GY795_36950 [Desulfobacterales bacterium]|nr:hypothetical protein [Desulfobacterales bacterium]
MRQNNILIGQYSHLHFGNVFIIHGILIYSNMKQFYFVLTVFFLVSNCTQDIRSSESEVPWDTGDLFKSCEKEIFHRQKGYDIKEIHLLAWYRIADKRPWHVDNALCRAELKKHDGKTKWALLHMGRNPGPQYDEFRNRWAAYPVSDAPDAAVLFFDYPPGNKDIYERMLWFDFKIEKTWILYDYNINREVWKKVTGETPRKEFETY